LGPHSYDPGIAANGVFWTTPIPQGGVDVNLGAGRASLQVENVHVTDWFTVPNSLNPAHPLGSAPALINSLKIDWNGASRRVEFKDSVNRFAGLFVEDSAAIEVTVTTAPTLSAHGFQFVSTPGSTSTIFAQVGHDHNGSFFPG
jgi:hypothetical protein